MDVLFRSQVGKLHCAAALKSDLYTKSIYKQQTNKGRGAKDSEMRRDRSKQGFVNNAAQPLSRHSSTEDTHTGSDHGPSQRCGVVLQTHAKIRVLLTELCHRQPRNIAILISQTRMVGIKSSVTGWCSAW